MRRNVEKCAFVRNGHGNIGKMEAPHHRPHGRTPTTATTYVASASCHESFLPRNVNVDRFLRQSFRNQLFEKTAEKSAVAVTKRIVQNEQNKDYRKQIIAVNAAISYAA